MWSSLSAGCHIVNWGSGRPCDCHSYTEVFWVLSPGRWCRDSSVDSLLPDSLSNVYPVAIFSRRSGQNYVQFADKICRIKLTNSPPSVSRLSTPVVSNLCYAYPWGYAADRLGVVENNIGNAGKHTKEGVKIKKPKLWRFGLQTETCVKICR
jgi:hypothetical protein